MCIIVIVRRPLGIGQKLPKRNVFKKHERLLYQHDHDSNGNRDRNKCHQEQQCFNKNAHPDDGDSYTRVFWDG